MQPLKMDKERATARAFRNRRDHQVTQNLVDNSIGSFTRARQAMAPKRKQPTTSEQTDKKPSGTKAAKPGVPTVVYRVEYQLSGPYMQTERVTVGMYSTKALAVANSKAALDGLSPWRAMWREEHMHAKVNQFTNPPDSGQLYCFQSEGGDAETLQVTIESINLDTIDTPYTPREVEGNHSDKEEGVAHVF